MKVAGQSRLPFRYRCREYRFGQSVGDGSAVYDLALPEVCGQPRHHFRLHQLLHLEGNARQGDDRLAAPGEPHARCCTVHVLKHFGRGGNRRLLPIQLVVLDAACGEYPAVAFVGLPVAYHFAAEDACQRLFRDVVLRGTETAGDDDRVGGAHGSLDRIGYLPPVVADGEFPHYGEPCFVQPCGYPCRIGIDDLADEDFVPYGDDFCFHVVWFYRRVNL